PTAAWAAIWRERSNNSALACALAAGRSRATSYGACGQLIDCSTVSKVLRLGACMREPRTILSRASHSDVAPNHPEPQGARAAESPQSATRSDKGPPFPSPSSALYGGRRRHASPSGPARSERKAGQPNRTRELGEVVSHSPRPLVRRDIC